MHAIEPDGADFEVIADDEVKVCNTKDCAPVMTKAKPAFNYKLGACHLCRHKSKSR